MYTPRSVTNNVNQPSLTDYELDFPRVPCNTTPKQTLFEIITRPAHILEVLICLNHFNISPIGVYKKFIQSAIDRHEIGPLSHHEKQFVGVVTLAVMGCNGYTKTGKKQRFSKGIFKSGEIYSR